MSNSITNYYKISKNQHTNTQNLKKNVTKITESNSTNTKKNTSNKNISNNRFVNMKIEELLKVSVSNNTAEKNIETKNDDTPIFIMKDLEMTKIENEEKLENSKINSDKSCHRMSYALSTRVKKQLFLETTELKSKDVDNKSVPAYERFQNLTDPTSNNGTPQLKRTFDHVEPIQTDNKMPAFKRFSNLVKDGHSDLILPDKYILIYNMFRSMDSILYLLSNRKEACTFEKLETSVSEMLHRKFSRSHLAQILYVYPDAFVVYEDKPSPGSRWISSDAMPSKKLVLHIESNYTENTNMVNESNIKSPIMNSPSKSTLVADLTNSIKSSPPTRLINYSFRCDDLVDTNKHLLLSPTKKTNPSISGSSNKLIIRLNKFKELLTDIVKKHHSEFLKSIGFKRNIESDRIKRWHPLFRLEEVPDIPCVTLPNDQTVHIVLTAQQILERSHVDLTSKIENALINASAKITEHNLILKQSNINHDSDIIDNFPNNNNAQKEQPVFMKTIDQDLIKRIQQKERNLNDLKNCMDPKKQKEMLILERLPEIARCLYNFFNSERKVSITIEACISNLMHSCSVVANYDTMYEHIEFLCSKVDGWIKLIKVNTNQYVKIVNKTMNITIVLDSLQQQLKLLSTSAHCETQNDV